MNYSYYCSEGILFDFCEGKRLEGRLLNSAATLSIFNPASEKTASVQVTLYFEDMEPVMRGPFLIESEKVWRLHLHEPLTVPHNAHYAIKVEADIPVVSQHTMSDFSPFSRIPNDMETVALYPGPLGEKETAWYFTDTWMGTDDRRVWYEYETLSITNPGQEVADVRLKFLGSQATGTKLEFERETVLSIAPRRVLAVRLWDLAEMKFSGKVSSDGGHEKSVDFSTWLRASVPVVPQKIRRAYKQFDAAIFGTWTVIGTPCGGADSIFAGEESHE